MWGRIASSSFMLATGLAAASACAMSGPAGGSHSRCTVIGAGKLPAEAGDSSALCAAIERAVTKRAPGVRYSVEVQVTSKSGLKAVLTADGRRLPDQGFSVSDRNLNPASLQRFADAIAELIATAARP